RLAVLAGGVQEEVLAPDDRAGVAGGHGDLPEEILLHLVVAVEGQRHVLVLDGAGAVGPAEAIPVAGQGGAGEGPESQEHQTGTQRSWHERDSSRRGGSVCGRKTEAGLSQTRRPGQ